MRLRYPATERNRDPILAVLRRVLPESGLVVEVGSGSGEHGLYFSRALPALRWQPTDPDPECRRSIDDWRADAGDNLLPAMELDATAAPWPIDSADAIVSINMIHIAPWEACLGLLDGAARLLGNGAPLFLYGPFARGGSHTAPSNEAFDQSLKARDPSWGVRDLDEVAGEAGRRGFGLEEIVAMPANNLSVVFRRTASA